MIVPNEAGNAKAYNKVYFLPSFFLSEVIVHISICMKTNCVPTLLPAPHPTSSAEKGFSILRTEFPAQA